MDTELQDWLRTHPYLSRIADVQGRVEDAAARAEAAPPPAPEQWEAYRAEYGRGIALLRAEQGRPDVAAHAARAGDAARTHFEGIGTVAVSARPG
jgi:FdhE protein